MTFTLSIIVAAFVGFILGHAYARWTRHCFIQSLIRDEGTSDREPDGFGCAVEGLGVHAHSSTETRERHHVR